ncbi:polysaccharide pyruvyl transferase family protein [Altererythrobacter sp. B11]|uniref:polysaccharide pyruvyl transferase family protein n=1 Tax=Altererythrobacter sp. B11 TaxID=2060312 RepID=UPI000E5B0FB9|nr:polysaccharide pyruvyl transferase family protein [Altererythrobacter sp. B11]
MPARRMKICSRSISDILSVWHNPFRTPTVYFTNTPNVGDRLNEFILPLVSGRKILKVHGNAVSHLRAIGSVVGSAGPRSRIWGSGSIDGAIPKRPIKAKNVFAVRGPLTRGVLEAATGQRLEGIPMGDPALLMPKYYPTGADKRFAVGIVPHFSDEEEMRNMVNMLGSKDVIIINVRQNPTSFVDLIVQCDLILSSSLHGLILADAYQIPNTRILGRKKLLGGNFKFDDYYATTFGPQTPPLIAQDIASFREAVRCAPANCRVHDFRGDLKHLLDQFPEEYRSW